MDERGQRKAIKHAQSCVIGDANRWMLQKEFHHLYPFVAATIFAMPNKTGAAARSTSQGVSIASKSIPSRVIRNFPLVYFTGVLLLGTVKGWKTENPACGQQSGVFALCVFSFIQRAAWATQFGLGNLFAAADRGVAGDRSPIACGFFPAHPLTASNHSRLIWPAVLL